FVMFIVVWSVGIVGAVQCADVPVVRYDDRRIGAGDRQRPQQGVVLHRDGSGAVGDDGGASDRRARHLEGGRRGGPDGAVDGAVGDDDACPVGDGERAVDHRIFDARRTVDGEAAGVSAGD